MPSLNERIRQLENIIKSLQAKVIDLTEKTEAARVKPESRVPLIDLGHQTPLPSSGTGLGKVPGKTGGIFWNDADATTTPWGEQPSEPTKGYNKHAHGRYSGGALDIHSLELVKYETNESAVILDAEGNPLNKDCQAYWKVQPNIEKDENGIEKISDLSKNIVWDKEEKSWRFIAVYADSEE